MSKPDKNMTGRNKGGGKPFAETGTELVFSKYTPEIDQICSAPYPNGPCEHFLSKTRECRIIAKILDEDANLSQSDREKLFDDLLGRKCNLHLMIYEFAENLTKTAAVQSAIYKSINFHGVTHAEDTSITREEEKSETHEIELRKNSATAHFISIFLEKAFTYVRNKMVKGTWKCHDRPKDLNQLVTMISASWNPIPDTVVKSSPKISILQEVGNNLAEPYKKVIFSGVARENTRKNTKPDSWTKRTIIFPTVRIYRETRVATPVV